MKEDKAQFPVRMFIRPAESFGDPEWSPLSESASPSFHYEMDYANVLIALLTSFATVARKELHTTHKLRSVLCEQWKAQEAGTPFDLRVLTEDNNVALIVSKLWHEQNRQQEVGFIFGSEEPADVLVRHVGGAWNIVEVKPRPNILVSSQSMPAGYLRDTAKTISHRFAALTETQDYVRHLFQEIEREIIVPESSLRDMSSWLRASARRVSREADAFDERARTHQTEFQRRILALGRSREGAPS
ncbi:hypothetical protein [Azovibrio restrictus]|uniref:hypothetical protein n=1 Tax=Azovibrio restrictus TaxID=146938 RepID=UPI0012EBF5DC|nr:hypothetical protein [Azovibrio restrictus]